MRNPIMCVAMFAFAITFAAHATTKVELLETFPPSTSDIVVPPGEDVYLRIGYETDAPTHIWARPYFQGKEVAAGSSPSLEYSGKGELNGSQFGQNWTPFGYFQDGAIGYKSCEIPASAGANFQFAPCDRFGNSPALITPYQTERLMRGQHHELEDAFRFLAGREADRLGGADLGVMFAHDLGPAGDHARLDEAEAAEGGAADLRRQLGDGARRPAARPFVAARLHFHFRLGVPFHRRARHAIGAA